MAAEEDVPAPGVNATSRTRSQRTRDNPARHPPAEAAAAATDRQEQSEQEGDLGFLSILNWLVFFFVMQNVVGALVARFMPPPPGGNDVVPDSPTSLSNYDGRDFVGESDAAAAADRKRMKPLGAGEKSNHDAKPMRDLNTKMVPKPSCLWQLGTLMDLDVLVTDSPRVPDGWPPLTTPVDDDESADDDSPRSKKGRRGEVLASWHEERLILGGMVHEVDKRSSVMSLFSSNANQAMNHRNATLVVPVTKSVWNNETHVYAHVRLQRRRKFKDGKRRPPRKDDVLVKRMALTRYRKRKKMRDVKSLLDAPSEADDLPSTAVVDPNDTSVLTAASLNRTHEQLLLYMKPSLTLQVVDMGPVDFPTRQSIPKQFSDHMDWYQGEDEGPFPMGDYYYPILYGSEFWITHSSLREVNGTLKESRLDVTYEPVPMWKWQLQSQTEENWRKQEAFTGEEDQGNDMLRNMLLDTNPYLLAITAVVSMLHTVFDILAFKNDISFFKNKKSMEGISLRSMIVNVGFSLVILLYLADNETSYMVLMSNGVGLAIDVWKISKALTVSFEGGKIQWVEAQSYKKSKTKEYDEIATSHLLFVTMPLVAGYGIYSLFYQKHKGWYSWILNTLVGFIYMFGFVMMTPQLFINYKLQSVAHLNWRTMTYKSINTFIDDLFAFVIKMPIMHRMACLRDDLIFFIYLFQRYKYRTDYTRVNEFGQCVQPTEEMLKEVAAAAEQTEQQPGEVTVKKRRGAREKRD
mmetsp:Transcript_5772/g.12699  ORF Transcript_5772/g.12699 Transcript_5772/m.12699 type:complete len:746 (-) Transcript_5772:70-2307(-)